jgi:outer membrane protein, heavy metal efflux system
MHFYRSTAMVAYALFAVGCSADRAAQPEPNNSVAPPQIAGSAPIAASGAPASASGTINDLVRRARDRHPTAEALRATRDAALARETTARAWANPELEMAVGRTHPRLEGLDQDVPYGATLKQRLEWIGKRDARQQAARAQTAAVEADAAVVLNDLELDVRLAVIALGIAQEEAQQAAADATLAEQVRAAVEQGHTAGDRDTATLIRVKLEAANAQVRRDSAQRSERTARAVLRLWCGEEVAEPLPITDVLPATTLPLNSRYLMEIAQRDPRVAALAAAIREAEANIAAERAARVPDVTVGVFADRENEKDAVGLSLGIELPVWNQNGGPIAEAEAQHRLATAELRRRQVEQRLELAATIGDYDSTQAQAESLRKDVLPLAEETLRLRTVGFANGDFSLTDLLEARRALLAAQAAALDARRRTAETLVRLGHIVGRYELVAPQTNTQEKTP